MLDHTPGFDVAGATRLVRDLYALDAGVRPLPSERDQNFLVEPAVGARFVLKIANALEDPAMLDAQQRAIMHVAPSLPLAPRIVPTRAGETVTAVAGPDGRTHLVWAITHLPGVPLATVRDRPPALLERLGEEIGALTRALGGFDHPAIHRRFHWDLATGRALVAKYRPLIADAALGAAIDAIGERFDRLVAPMLPSLRRSAIHGDLNDYNVLVDHGVVTGIVDFGDMVYGYTVGDLAIAAAYVVLDATDPLDAAATVVRGYAARFALTDDELAALFGLIALRLAMSACVAAHQMRQRPDNAYLDISQAAIRRTLPRLARIPFGLATAVFRDACGVAPVPASGRIVAWLAGRTFAPVLGLALAPYAVLDLSVGSPLVSSEVHENDEPALTDRIGAALRARNVRVGIGRYDEARLLYTAPFFGDGDRRRTIHLGIDLFAPAGTRVHAPLRGVVHAVADNRARQDYGPVVVLRHATGDGDTFYTLYGHLGRTERVRVGDTVEAGEVIGEIGTADVNVGWTPHLHLQIIVDPLDMECDFPGVGWASQRAVWRALCPDPGVLAGVRVEPAPDKAATLAERRRLVGRGLSIAYHDPLRLVRGWRQYLYDDDGRRYLDAYNNVPHVGHGHPRVVEAARAQMMVLNTNTRYLSERLTEYAARLVSMFPPPLGVCYIVNSASEANELAMRLARARTGQKDMIVLDAAYHGNTTGLIDISPYKHGAAGGAGPPPWVHVAPLPDDYRGAYRRGEVDIGRKYARHVAELAAPLRGRLAGFIAETCPSVGGQIVLPDGYLAQVYRDVRAAGGVCIADEVQTGLGRIGTHVWAFEAHDVVPDIVVLGKPIGNGHPLAAVITTAEIADAFDNGMEFFSTFGGNTVSCAVGLAVLDVLRDEELQAQALGVGERLLAGLRPFVDRYAQVGDVRGSGLFLGVELVHDRETRAPAADAAAAAVNRMRELGILLGTDGPHHNVIKIRPPMPFDHGDADQLVETLGRVLDADRP